MCHLPEDKEVQRQQRRLHKSSLSNPSFGWRVGLVAGIWAVVGALAFGMLNLFLPLAEGSATGFVLGGSVGAVLGGLLEAFYG